MKNKRSVSLLLTYIFILTLIPFNFISSKVKAEGLTNYKTSNGLYTKLAVQYKDKTVIIAKDKKFEKGVNTKLRLIQIENGKETVINEDEDFLFRLNYMGAYGEKLYFLDSDKKLVYVYNLNTKELKPSNSIPNINVSAPDADKYVKYINNGDIDSKGNQWFQGAYYNPNDISDEGRATDTHRRFIMNTKGLSKEFKNNDCDILNIIKSNMSNNFAYMTIKKSEEVSLNLLDDKGNIKKYNFDKPEFEPIDTLIDANSNIYTIRMKQNYTYLNGRQQMPEFILQHYIIKDGVLSLVKEFKLIGEDILEFDKNGSLWVVGLGKVSKLENEELIEKFTTSENRYDMSIYDDNHFTIYGVAGYVIVSNNDKVEDATNSNNQSKDSGQNASNPSNNNNNGNTNNSSSNDNKSSNNEKVAVSVSSLQNGTEAVLKVNSAEIAKDKTNQIEANIDSTVKTVEVKLDAAAIKDGKGSVEIKVNNMVINLPFSTIDFSGAGNGAYVSIKQTINSDDLILNGIKSVKKVFEFNMTTYDNSGNKIKDIHQFKDGKVKISFKLSDEDIKGLDINKLTAFYYNENTKAWDNMGGSFDKETKTFTFETPHFSKFTISEVNPATSLPKTGSFVDMNLLLAIGFIVLAVGVTLTVKKKLNFNK